MSNLGYIKLPRCLLDDPLWIDLSLEDQHVFLILLQHVCYKPRKFDDHGHLIELNPGQICITERDLVKLCNKKMTRIKVQRSLVRLRLCRFMSQEVRHKKSIITITHSSTYELINNIFEPTNEPNLSQTRAKLEPETNKEKKDNNMSVMFVPRERGEKKFLCFKGIGQYGPRNIEIDQIFESLGSEFSRQQILEAISIIENSNPQVTPGSEIKYLKSIIINKKSQKIEKTYDKSKSTKSKPKFKPSEYTGSTLSLGSYADDFEKVGSEK